MPERREAEIENERAFAVLPGHGSPRGHATPERIQDLGLGGEHRPCRPSDYPGVGLANKLAGCRVQVDHTMGRVQHDQGIGQIRENRAQRHGHKVKEVIFVDVPRESQAGNQEAQRGQVQLSKWAQAREVDRVEEPGRQDAKHQPQGLLPVQPPGLQAGTHEEIGSDEDQGVGIRRKQPEERALGGRDDGKGAFLCQPNAVEIS